MEFFFAENTEIKADYKEVARYSGYTNGAFPDETVSAIIENSVREMQQVLRPALVFEKFSISVSDGKTDFFNKDGEFLFEIFSKDLSKNLWECSYVILFASTIGTQSDFLIRKYQKSDSVKAGIMQATGAMFIESFVDSFNEKIKNECFKEGKFTKPRYSPGYGDVPLDVQKLFFQYLDTKKIGLSLMDSLIMAPEKSVTAFIGIK